MWLSTCCHFTLSNTGALIPSNPRDALLAVQWEQIKAFPIMPQWECVTFETGLQTQPYQLEGSLPFPWLRVCLPLASQWTGACLANFIVCRLWLIAYVMMTYDGNCTRWYIAWCSLCQSLSDFCFVFLKRIGPVLHDSSVVNLQP